MHDIKDLLKYSKNNFIFQKIKYRKIPILDVIEDIELLDDDLNNQLNKNGLIKMEEQWYKYN